MSALSRQTDSEPRIAIVGAGLMGAGIATVFLAAQVRVAVYDPAAAALDTLPGRIGAGLALLGVPGDGPLAQLSVSHDLGGAVRQADLIIEAAPEKLAVKRDIFAELASTAAATAVLASNTSAIPIGDISAGMPGAERVIGTHFWNPPYLLPLVEVVQANMSDPAAVSWTIDLLTRVGMKPVLVKADVPGFVGNRLQHALKREAIAIVANGICSAETVDTVTRYGFGPRLGIVGPLEQSDLGGLELTLAIHETLMPALDTTTEPHPLLVQKVRAGETGAAAGRGFRTWLPGEAQARREEIAGQLAALARNRFQLQREAAREMTRLPAAGERGGDD